MKAGLILIILIAIGAVAYGFTSQRSSSEMGPPSLTNNRLSQNPSADPNREDVEVIAENLDIPWEVAFLPDGDILITERPGVLLRISDELKQIEIDGVHHVGEGGLLGLAIHPDFEENNYVYLYLTSQESGQIYNRVDRYELIDVQLTNRTVIIDDIPGSANHDGGRIAFGPDGYLYITTGDAQVPQSAQDTNALSGKILRLNDDGTVPQDNPFNNPVYSFGHRNPQGLAWDDQGRLWSTEHGRSGISSGFDEINLIEKGNNYGWPIIQGDEQQQGMITPVRHSGANDTWAPAGAIVLNEKLYFTGLRGAALYEIPIENLSGSELEKNFEDQYGRLRAVTVGPEGDLYITTSNQDGRGRARPTDDKLIRINPEILK